jgi:hypothetical protein
VARFLQPTLPVTLAISEDATLQITIGDKRAQIREAVFNWLRKTASDGIRGRFDHPMPIALPYEDPRHKWLVDAEFISVLWDLVAEGLIVPGNATELKSIGRDDQRSWPWFTLTAYGVAVVTGQSDTISPHDATRYLTDAHDRLPLGDDEIIMYLEEANRAFIARLYPSSVVMLGVSAEALMEWLIKQMRKHLQPNAVSRFDLSLNKDGRATSDRFSTLLDELRRHKKEMSKDLFALIDPQLGGVVTLLKTYRDDVAHRRPFRIDSQLADGQLRLYLPTLSVASELAEVLQKPCVLLDN